MPEPDRRAARGAPVLLLSSRDGVVVAQSRAASRLLGDGVGRPCAEVVGGLAGAEGLPCAPGCVQRMVHGGVDASHQTQIRVRRRRHVLTCMPTREGAACLLSDPGARAPRLPWQTLTAREVDVLRGLASGSTTPEIAATLGISRATARTHVENMRTKLDAATHAGLVALGFRLGFLD